MKMSGPTIDRKTSDGVDTVTLQRGDILEASITVHVNGRKELGGLLEEAHAEVESMGATVLRQNVFGTPARHDSASEMLREMFGQVDWPVTWLEEGDSLGERLTGTHLYAVRGVDVRRLAHNGDVVGSVISDGEAEYCYLGGIVSGNLAADRPQQTRDVLERLEEILRLAGMDFHNVARTWFYNDRILDWYDEFNVARTQFFEERKVFDGLVPASTGVGGGNLHGAALVADALAVKPLAGGAQLRVEEVASPLQCPATAYRSSFSRAVEVAASDHRRLYISGTASIAPEGETVHLDDTVAQVNLTLDVVAAILESRGMSWADVSRAIAYVKRGADVDSYFGCLGRRGITGVPAVVTENDICRDDLLFELEVDAIATAQA